MLKEIKTVQGAAQDIVSQLQLILAPQTKVHAWATRVLYLRNRPLVYGFTGAINHEGCWENKRQDCKSRTVRQVIYKLFECSFNIS